MPNSKVVDYNAKIWKIVLQSGNLVHTNTVKFDCFNYGKIMYDWKTKEEHMGTYTFNQITRFQESINIGDIVVTYAGNGTDIDAIGIVTGDAEYDEKGSSYRWSRKVLYYIHILGDHKDDTSWKIQNGLKMGVGGRTDNNDIIHELLESFEILFADQKHTHKYRSLTGNLQKIDSRFGKVVNSVGGVNSDEKFVLYQEYVDDTLKILTLYLSEMLKDEAFFHEVFYQ